MMTKKYVVAFMLFVPLLLKAAIPTVHDTGRGIELKNANIAITLSHDAELLSFVDLRTNVDMASNSGKRIASIKTVRGQTVDASRLSLEANIIHVTIGDGSVDLRIEAFDDFFTVEVLNARLPEVVELTFMDLALKYDYSATEALIAAGVAMTLNTDHSFYPSGESKRIKGRCLASTGFNGAKLAIISSPKQSFWEIVKRVYHAIPENSVPVAYYCGGPFAQDNESNRYDCVIIGGSEVNPAKVPEWINFYYKKLGIRQFDFHYGATSFTQGQFEFPTLGSARAFKEQITDPLYSEGIISTLHSYAYYIDYSAKEILSNPEWQKHLEIRESYTLTEPITSNSKEICVAGNVKNLGNSFSYTSVNSPFLLIDNEIIRYSVGDKGFVSCKRGQCGTIANNHKKGSEVKVIGGYFNMIAPQVGSELYYEIARRTAKAYNEGGFRGLYFDAIDGLGVQLQHAGLDGCEWYYGASFINEVLKYCENPPQVIEYSDIYPSIWAARGRAESWDKPRRGYKAFIDKHTSRNQTLINRNYVTTLGWFDFYPDNKEQPGDFYTKYMFFDDVDYIGVKAIAYDQTMTYDGLKQEAVASIPALERNLSLFSQYNSLRMSNYFSEQVKNVLKEGTYEYKLCKKREKWGFKETVYCRSILRNITNCVFTDLNPFKKQGPFIRLENLFSSDCLSMVHLMNSEELAGLNNNNCEKEFSTPLNLTDHLGIKVSLIGNGGSSEDALCIRMRSAETGGYADYIVHLNFDGIREIVISNTDNAEYRGLFFTGADNDLYKVHRRDVDFSQVKYIQVFKSSNCESANVLSVDAVPLVSNALTNPVLTLNGASVTFQGTLQSGEYLEYNAGERIAVVYDSMGNSRTVKVKRSGRFRVPAGDYTATVSGVAEHDNMPADVSLTFGLYGAFIHN